MRQEEILTASHARPVTGFNKVLRVEHEVIRLIFGRVEIQKFSVPSSNVSGLGHDAPNAQHGAQKRNQSGCRAGNESVGTQIHDYVLGGNSNMAK